MVPPSCLRPSRRVDDSLCDHISVPPTRNLAGSQTGHEAWLISTWATGRPTFACRATAAAGSALGTSPAGRSCSTSIGPEAAGGPAVGTRAARPDGLCFAPAEDRPACTAEAVDFSRLGPEFGKAGAVVVGISPDSARKHDKFKARHGLGVDLLADEERQAIEAYGLWVEKKLYGRTYMGVERATFLIGADGRIARIWRKVRVKGHAEEVLEAAKHL